MELLLGLLLIVVLVIIAVWLYVARQGDAEFEFLVDQRTDVALQEVTADSATFSCTVPFVNKGTQDGTIMDCYARHLLPYEQYDAVETKSWLALESRPRDDGYFEALIVPKTTGSAVVVTVKFMAKQGNIKQALTDMVDMPVDIVFQVVARGTWYISKQRLIIRASELASAINAGLASA